MLLFALYVRTLPPPVPKAAPQKLDVKGVPKKESLTPGKDDLPDKLLEDLEKDDDDDDDVEEERGGL